MDLSTLITIIAGLAGIAGFFYLLFIGQKSLIEWLREKRLSRNEERPKGDELPHPSERGKITKVTWDCVILAVDKFVSECKYDYDLIVGIAKGGLPIAVALAYRLKSSRFSAMLKRYIDVKQAPFFIFEEESHRRSIRSRVIDSFTLPVHNKAVKHVLIVDDVATFGNSLETAEILIKEQLKNAEVDFFVYAADIARLSATKPNISERVTYYHSIDNRLEWLQFPWE